jgi:hypothetical protein
VTRARRSWWRDNRLWLAALPLSVLAAAAGSSYNVKDLWYDRGLNHEVASGEQGRWLEVSQEFTDRIGDTSRTYRVRLNDLEKTSRWPYYDDGPREPPADIDAVAAHLDWQADPDQQLAGCRLALEDDEGRRYELDSGDSLDLCTPTDHPGPLGPLSADGVRDEVEPGTERPPTWSTAPVFLVPEGRRITRLLVFWGQPPDYVTISVS